MAAITMRALSKEFPGGVRAVDALDLEIADGEFFALLGPSGCGKTTLLRTIAGLEAASGGSVYIGERDVTSLAPGKRDIAMVFQDYALFPHMTVADNIAYPLKIRKVGQPQRRTKAAEAATGLSLGALLDRRPGQLSGGQQQRAALARAVACHPSVFLFDEPLSNLDARLRLEARTFLKRLQRELGVTTVFVTHDQAEALAMSDRMAVMDAGRIRQVGSPTEVFQRPADTFVANFIGSTPMNLIPGFVEGGHVRLGTARLALPSMARGHVRDGQRVVYGVRPEYAELSPSEPSGGPDGALSGRVGIVENLGTAHLVSVECGVPHGGIDGGTDSGIPLSVQVTVSEGEEPRIGTTVWVVPRRDRSLLYRESDGGLVTSPQGAHVVDVTGPVRAHATG